MSHLGAILSHPIEICSGSLSGGTWGGNAIEKVTGERNSEIFVSEGPSNAIVSVCDGVLVCAREVRWTWRWWRREMRQWSVVCR